MDENQVWDAIEPSALRLPVRTTVYFCLAPVGFFAFAHLATAALRALALRSSGVSFAALFLPPFEPPILPNATAFGFFSRIQSYMLTPTRKIKGKSLDNA
jgi:hypothetical protein